RDGVVEEEQRRPATRSRQRPAPVAKRREADDPQGAAVMAHHALSVVDDAPPVAGEQTARRDGVEVTPRVHSVATRHAGQLCTPRRRWRWRADVTDWRCRTNRSGSTAGGDRR